MIPSLDDIAIFHAVIKYQSFTAAADALHVSKSHVSKRIQSLERRLVTHLLHRRGRQLQLTVAGDVLWQTTQTLLEQLEHGLATIETLQGSPSGKLKISIPPAFANDYLAKHLIAFTKQYPRIQLELCLESRITDIIGEHYDVAIRSTKLADSRFVAKAIGSCEQWLCASPAFIRKLPEAISHPKQLLTLPMLLLPYQVKQRTVFHHEKKKISFNLNAVTLSDHLHLLRQFAMADCGITILPDFSAKSAIAKKQLVRVLPNYQLEQRMIYAVYPEREFMPPKLRLFLDFIANI